MSLPEPPSQTQDATLLDLLLQAAVLLFQVPPRKSALQDWEQLSSLKCTLSRGKALDASLVVTIRAAQGRHGTPIKQLLPIDRKT